MRLTRGQLLSGAAATALAGAGIYELVERHGSAAPRTAAPPPPEQHLLPHARIVRDDGVEVVEPPLHTQIVTLRLRVAPQRRALRNAQGALEHALRAVEAANSPAAGGVSVTVGWGLPYFHRFVAGPAAAHLPVDRRASRAAGARVEALLEAERFPSDPAATILEQNDAVLLLRGDRLGPIADAAAALVTRLGIWEPTSIRRGFAGGGFGGGRSLPKTVAMAAGVPGADLIPDRAELFLGFTSTQRAALGPGRIANLETLGYADGGAGGYFTRGTTMHLSHIAEDLESWYLAFDDRDRLDTLFHPGQRARAGVLTVRQDAADVSTAADTVRIFHRDGAIGHSGPIQAASRLTSAVTGADGTVYPAGTAVPQRADSNTIDNPFFWSSRPAADGMRDGAAAGVHFVVFHPTSDDFRRTRLAMDGVLPDGTRLPLPARSRRQGINSVLTTTHRQNFLVPPRVHRSLPLVEFLR
jgi:hypothetical protein